MQTTNWKEKLQYQFDNLMAKGTIALVGMLFLATAAVVVFAGLALVIVTGGETSFGGNIWASIMHIIDAGTITAADTGDVAFVVLMSLVTLCGLFVTSILIGIITTGFEEKLNDLKKGNSRVLEQNHTVILGFDSNVYTLISELVTANENQKDGCIVLLANEDKETVESAIAAELPNLKNTRIICRTGNITDTHMLRKCSIETSRSIIINESEDFMTVKAILAISNYLEEQSLAHRPHIVATIQEESNYEAVQIISKGDAEILLVQDAISRIIAQTCRQPGLSNVLMELFDYDGDELYFENVSSLAGQSFGDVLSFYEKAVLFGFRREGKVYLNPDKESILHATDDLLLLVEDDGAAKPVRRSKSDHLETFVAHDSIETHPEHILILGTNEMLPNIAGELDNYFTEGSRITVAAQTIDSQFEPLPEVLSNIALTFVTCDTNNRASLEALTADGVQHVLILSSDDCDAETSDAMTLLKLIHLRDIAKKSGATFTITSEMQDVANQKLARVAEANDLVVGSNIINLILTQISESRDLSSVFQELLSADGSEIYIRKASHYVQLNTKMTFYDVTEILRAQNEIAIGYKKQVGNTFEIVTNPTKSEKISFAEGDAIISLAMD